MTCIALNSFSIIWPWDTCSQEGTRETYFDGRAPPLHISLLARPFFAFHLAFPNYVRPPRRGTDVHISIPALEHAKIRWIEEVKGHELAFAQDQKVLSVRMSNLTGSIPHHIEMKNVYEAIASFHPFMPFIQSNTYSPSHSPYLTLPRTYHHPLRTDATITSIPSTSNQITLHFLIHLHQKSCAFPLWK